MIVIKSCTHRTVSISMTEFGSGIWIIREVLSHSESISSTFIFRITTTVYERVCVDSNPMLISVHGTAGASNRQVNKYDKREYVTIASRFSSAFTFLFASHNADICLEKMLILKCIWNVLNDSPSSSFSYHLHQQDQMHHFDITYVFVYVCIHLLSTHGPSQFSNRMNSHSFILLISWNKCVQIDEHWTLHCIALN